MKKTELKSGMIVEYSNGKKRLIVNNNLIGDDAYTCLSNYSDDLRNIAHSDLDIMKVYNYNAPGGFNRLLEDDNLVLIWEHKEIKLTNKEIEILKALRVLGYEFLARDENTDLCAYSEKPYKDKYGWMVYGGTYISVNDDVLELINWEDEEPTKINSLLENEKLWKKDPKNINPKKKKAKNKVKFIDGFRYYPQPYEVPKAPPIKKKQNEN